MQVIYFGFISSETSFARFTKQEFSKIQNIGLQVFHS